MKRVFSGVQPTGNLHLGNYLGAIRNFVRLQDRFECIYCVVDLHAITMWQDPRTLAGNTREIAAAYLAAGVDAGHSVIFSQSQVPAHTELAWLFNCVARIGWLNRMTQFKDKAGRNRESASVGLYVYPALMAADILAYRATHVPVGEDQKQHLELTRDIAQKFNTDFGTDLFPLPEPLISGPATRVMSLRDGRRKMSKSDPSDYSRILLSDDADAIAQKIRKARTDPEPVPGPDSLTETGAPAADRLAARPEAFNLLAIHAALTDRGLADVVADHGGQPFSRFKTALTEATVASLGPVTAEWRRLMADPGHIDTVLREGAARARTLTAPVMAAARTAVGLLAPG